MFVQSEYCVCLGTCVCFASQQCFPACETGSATLATWGKHRKSKVRALNSNVFFTTVMERQPELVRQREQWVAHTVSPKRHKCSNWRVGVIQMARHRQKVNYEAVERKDSYGRIRTFLQKQSQQQCNSCLTVIINPKQKYNHIYFTVTDRKLKT